MLLLRASGIALNIAHTFGSRKMNEVVHLSELQRRERDDESRRFSAAQNTSPGARTHEIRDRMQKIGT
jgi:hypothetical protein